MNALRNYDETFIVGRVEKGKQLGKTIGFPTANLNLFGDVKLDSGVYGVYVYLQQNKYMGIMNVGTRPTFNDGQHQTYEVHVLNFNDNLYDKYLTIEIMFHIREERKFNGVEELISQIQADAFYAQSRFRLVN